MRRQGAFPESRAKFYAAQIALAFGYLHENEILYRDLKLENVKQARSAMANKLSAMADKPSDRVGTNISQSNSTRNAKAALSSRWKFKPGPLQRNGKPLLPLT